MGQHRPNTGSIYAQHGPDMIQKRRVPLGLGKGLKEPCRSWLDINSRWLEYGSNMLSKDTTWTNISLTYVPHRPNTA